MSVTALERPTPADDELELELRDGRLWARRGERHVAVKPTRCFPWSEPDRWVSLRDADGDEVALVEDPSDLDTRSRDALSVALRETAFVFDVTRIVAVEEEVEIRTWTVQTQQGLRRFQTARDAWPRELPTGEYLVRDVAGDLYRIGDPEQLDAESRRYLWAFVE
jgi:hypothetical protein